MLYLHETHEIIGGRTAQFESLYREYWLPALERSGLGRLLWFWHHTHGTGPSYQSITVTGIPDWKAWGDLVEACASSEAFARWNREAWQSRREVTGKLLQPASWSPPLPDASSHAAAPDAAPGLYLHDTGWPYSGKLEDYVNALGTIYYPQTRRSGMISVEACWTTCLGTGRFHEVVLLQKILNWDSFARLLTHGEIPSRRGDWMEEGLKYRDRWESKLLRTAKWSPMK
jgi:hypothetical protein